tara:strand:- start:208 stop:402 length:195 start_codon:yes stop_codon:yes gene_type:complete
MKKELTIRRFTTELNSKEISNILLACETLMEQLENDLTGVIDNKKHFYDLWDIRNKLNSLRQTT